MANRMQNGDEPMYKPHLNDPLPLNHGIIEGSFVITLILLAQQLRSSSITSC